MKKIMFLLAMLPLMMFTSCSSDDDEGDIGLTKEIITGGTWYVSAIEMDGSWEDMSEIGIRVVFDTDGEYRLGYGKYLDTTFYVGTWTFSGNTIKGVTVDGIKEFFKFTNINGNNVIIEYTNNDEIKTPLRCKASKKQA